MISFGARKLNTFKELKIGDTFTNVTEYNKICVFIKISNCVIDGVKKNAISITSERVDFVYFLDTEYVNLGNIEILFTQ